MSVLDLLEREANREQEQFYYYCKRSREIGDKQSIKYRDLYAEREITVRRLIELVKSLEGEGK
jgi:hypothetical protein